MCITTRCLSTPLTKFAEILGTPPLPSPLSCHIRWKMDHQHFWNAVLFWRSLQQRFHSPIGCLAGLRLYMKPSALTYGPWDRGVKASFKLLRCVNTLVWPAQSDISNANSSMWDFMWAWGTGRKPNSVGFIGYKHNSKELKHDDGINNVDKHASRMRSDSLKWGKRRPKWKYSINMMSF